MYRLLVVAALVSALCVACTAEPHDLATGLTRDGRLVVFGIDADRNVRHTVQSAPNANDFTPWRSLGQVATSHPTVLSRPDGAFYLFVRNSDSIISFKYLDKNATTADGWSEWAHLGNGFKSLGEATPVDVKGRITVFAIGQDSRLYSTQQEGKNPGKFSDWAVVSTKQRFAGVPTFNRASGRLTMWIRGTDNRVYRAQYRKSGWSKLRATGNLRVVDNPISGVNSDGRVESFVIGADNQLYHQWQLSTQDRTKFSRWSALGGTLTSRAAVGTTWDGRLQVFARGADNAIWGKQFRWDEGWGPWTSLSGKWQSAPTVANYKNGLPVILAVAKDSSLWFRSQTRKGEGAEWNRWRPIGGELY
eukprot:TRINITY_DN33269_c0_g1_i1.p1 TRINITY_DN33269_c0_g1~~TRINITY_DN33269_c0_g1_i1.p1  ORF type:complete len:361 (+),score=86.01 TRINITY_DN33269_c0_g1_i1:373-1455(+)